MTTRLNQLHNVTCVSQDIRVGKEDIWYFGSGELTGSSASAMEHIMEVMVYINQLMVD